jgi:hypothetical protein
MAAASETAARSTLPYLPACGEVREGCLGISSDPSGPSAGREVATYVAEIAAQIVSGCA